MTVRSLVLCLTLVALCARAASADATAVKITSPAQLIPGSTTQGSVGDYLLANDFIRVVIDDIPRPHGFANTGGNVIDAATAAGEDRFASMFTMFDNRFGRQANYTTIAIVNAGGGTNIAHIRVTGVDSEDPALGIVTDYRLGPNDRFVQVTTTLTNDSPLPIQQLQVGDAVQWGLTTHFAPAWNNVNRNVLGDGYDVGGKTLDVPWMAGDGQGTAYGTTVLSGLMEMSNGSTWSDANTTYLDIPANGGSGTYTRYFIVGTNSIASVSDVAFGIRGTATGTLSGIVSENVTGTPIGNASVTINTVACLGGSGSKSYTVARTAVDGSYAARLEPGTYYVQFQATGRTKPGCQTVAIVANTPSTLNQVLSRQGFLAWDVRDGSNTPLPAKISVLYEPATARFEGPTLGDNRSLIGGYAILSTAAGSTAVPPGTYKIWVTRGLEYEPVTQVVTVTEAATATVNATLQRVVNTAGYVSADMHVHGFNSADSAIRWEDRARQAAAEGLEIVVPTDHDFISEMDAAIAAAGVGAWVATMPGDEVTTNTWGHFNGYPLTPDTGLPRHGALDHTGLDPGAIFSALRSDPKQPVVQVNHPRAGGLGYFDLTALNPITAEAANPAYSPDFDAVEVFNGKRLYQVPLVRNDWYRLLNRGQKVTAVGNTDTHEVFGQELGYPRNFVKVGSDVPSAVSEQVFRDAVKAGNTLLTNGPFVELVVNGSAVPGELVADTTGSVDVRIRIEAPAAITVDTVNILVNGRIARTINVSPSAGIVQRLDQVYPITIGRDSWIAVEVTGGQCATDASNNCLVAGCPGRLDPIVPPLYGTDPVCPYAHTNPVYIDFDNNGVFDPPGNQGLKVEPIAAIRPVNPSTYDNTRSGEVVTVRGKVTAGSYTFDHRSNTLWFQDDSLDTANVLSGGTTTYQSSLINPIVEVGDRIEVTGTISPFNGLQELTGVAIKVLERGAAVPDPIVLTLAQVNDASRREQWEGMLVRIDNVQITSGTWPAFGNNANMTINDGTGSTTMRIDSDTDIDGGPQPSGTFDLVAEFGQFDSSAPYTSGYQLLPRQRADIIEGGNPQTILHQPGAEPVTACDATIRWYSTKTGGSFVDYGSTPAFGSTASGASGVTSHSVTLSGLAPATTYFYRASTDGVVSVTKSFTTAASATPKLVAGPIVNFVDDTTVQITWTTDLSSTSRVHYGTALPYGSTAAGPSGTKFHFVTIGGLSRATTYHFQVESTSTACGGGTLAAADRTFNTPVSPTSPPEVSAPGSVVPFTLKKAGTGLEFRFESRGAGYRYHIYGVGNEAAMDAGDWSVKFCNLATNTLGTFATDGATFVTFTLTDVSALPAANYVVVAEQAFVEGSYGLKSNGAFRTKDLDATTPADLGCVPLPACAAVSAAITGIAPSATVDQGTQQTFSAAGTGEGTLTFQWDFDYDGSTFDVMATGATAAYTYPSPGGYTTALRVTDSCANPAPQTALDTEAVTINGPACPGAIVISEVYGGGGNSGSTYRNDFIELFNRGGQAVDVTGWSVQYASSTGTTWQVTNLSGVIQPGRYYLVQEAQGAGGTTNLPAPDAIGTIPMSSSAGKVALVKTTTALTGACPTGTTLADFVGYGGANCFEGSAAAPALTNTTSDARAGGGCVDAGVNSSDFSSGSPAPQNSAAAANVCPCP